MEAKKGYRAEAKYLMVSPTKVRPIADIIRSRPFTDAVAQLDALPNKGAKILKKVIQSAAANALYQNKKLDEDMIYIKELQVNEGPRLKRVWARARGKRDILLKRMSHISVVVDEIAGMGE
jgi:large subunit ribosomal protein L22